MSKKIKKIDEFFDFDDDSRFDFNINTREISDEEEKEIRDHYNKIRTENLKDYPKTAGIERMTIDEFREIMYMAAELDNEPFTDDDIEELDMECMKQFGEPFFKKDDNTNE
jgi:hypothetical protein